MVHRRRVNLGFWFASELSNVISFNRPLIITQLAIFTTGLDIDETDLHIICPQTPLNLRSLDDMGLLELKDNKSYFAPPGPPEPRNMRIYGKKKEQAEPTATDSQRQNPHYKPREIHGLHLDAQSDD